MRKNPIAGGKLRKTKGGGGERARKKILEGRGLQRGREESMPARSKKFRGEEKKENRGFKLFWG